MHLDIGFAKDEVKTHKKKGGKTILCLLLMHEYKYDVCKTKHNFPTLLQKLKTMSPMFETRNQISFLRL